MKCEICNEEVLFNGVTVETDGLGSVRYHQICFDEMLDSYRRDSGLVIELIDDANNLIESKNHINRIKGNVMMDTIEQLTRRFK